MKTCRGKTKTGAACRAPAGPEGFCYFHSDPDRAKKLGQIGGRRNRRSAVDLEVPESPTATDVCKAIGQAMRLLLSGEMGAREASAFSQLSHSFSRFIPAADLERRVAVLEEQLAQEGQAVHEEDGLAPASDSTGVPADEIEAAEGDVSEQETLSSEAAIECADVSQQEAPYPVAPLEVEDGSEQEAASSAAEIEYEEEAEIPNDESGEAEEQ